VTWIVDILFFIILIAGIWLGATRGFVNSIAKLAGTLFSLIFAVMFAIALSNTLENWFGMTTALTNWIAGFFQGAEYTTEFGRVLSGAELSDALQDVNGFARILICWAFGGAETISASATPALLLGMTLAKWSSILISFVILFVIMKFGVYLLAKGLNALVNKVALFKIVNQTLGGVFGFVKAFLAILVLLMICTWLPIDGLHNYLTSSAIVGSIYHAPWFLSLTEYFFSGQWFSDFAAQFFQ